ncbi:hypothetical protein BGW80DRAFT_593306 [Lactifluus volemus]|nr:hypothetical protein BGW80DRAFT_593306 [Lactifluus volemus]
MTLLLIFTCRRTFGGGGLNSHPFTRIGRESVPSHKRGRDGTLRWRRDAARASGGKDCSNDIVWEL